MADIKELLILYNLRKSRIKSRLDDFSKVLNESNERIFEELCFCILTANSSAKSGIKAVNFLKPILLTASKQEIQEALKTANYRFPNKRAEYIIETRQFLKETLNFNLKNKIYSFNNSEELRDFFVTNIKGIGYKEASHFLRNIGLKGYCILDKHVINALHEFNIINSNNTPKNKKQYLKTESKMKEFANSLNINVDELDLLLWSRKTGEILK
ncbi:N-glycosylase/DNA lyase [Candidatus Woesearchaeota archaeon]|nr:N-glycosylase/DNA lyase [Candidatus Woesearchaeota archaeon]